MREGSVIAISWESIAGIVALVGAFISVMSVVVKVNGTLTRLDEAVRQLRVSIEAQQKLSESFERTLAAHETRITVLERERREA